MNSHTDLTTMTPEPSQSDEEIIINVQSLEDPTEEHKPAACCLRIRFARPGLFILPLGAALTSSAEVAHCLYTAKNFNMAVVGTATFFSFLSSIGLTFEATKENLEATCEIVKHQHLPQTEEWPELSYWGEISAISLTVLPGIWCPLSTAMYAYYFIEPLRGEYEIFKNIPASAWVGIGTSIATVAGVSEILTNTVEMYKTTRNWIAGESTDFTNQMSYCFSPSLGGFLGFTNALQESIQSYIAIKSIFSVTSTAGKIGIAIPTAFNIIPNFCFEGIYLINAMDEFFGYIQKREFEPIKILAFSASVAMSVYLAFVFQPLDVAFYADIILDMGISSEVIPAIVLETISWVMFVQRSLQTTATFYDPMLGLLDRIYNKFTSFTSYIHEQCSESETKIEEIQAKLDQQPLLSDLPIVIDIPDLLTDSDDDESSLLINHKNSLSHLSMFNRARHNDIDTDEEELEVESSCCSVSSCTIF